MVTLVVDGVKMAFFFFFFFSPPPFCSQRQKEEKEQHHFPLADARVWLDLLRGATAAVSSLFLPDQLPVSSDMKKSWERFVMARRLPFFFFSLSFSFFLLCRVPGGLLAACFLTGSLAGKSDSRTMNSVEWWISLLLVFFFFYPPSSSSSSLSSTWKTDEQRHVEVAWQERSSDCITQTEIAKLLFSPSRLFLLFPLLSSSPSLSAHFLPSSLCFLPVLSPNCSSSILP